MAKAKVNTYEDKVIKLRDAINIKSIDSRSLMDVFAWGETKEGTNYWYALDSYLNTYYGGKRDYLQRIEREYTFYRLLEKVLDEV